MASMGDQMRARAIALEGKLHDWKAGAWRFAMSYLPENKSFILSAKALRLPNEADWQFFWTMASAVGAPREALSTPLDERAPEATHYFHWHERNGSPEPNLDGLPNLGRSGVPAEAVERIAQSPEMLRRLKEVHGWDVTPDELRKLKRHSPS